MAKILPNTKKTKEEKHHEKGSYHVAVDDNLGALLLAEFVVRPNVIRHYVCVRDAAGKYQQRHLR